MKRALSFISIVSILFLFSNSYSQIGTGFKGRNATITGITSDGDTIRITLPSIFEAFAKFQSSVNMATVVEDSLNVDSGTLVVSPTTGFVGIGTISSAYKFEVKDGDIVVNDAANTGNPGFRLRRNGVNLAIIKAASNQLYISTFSNHHILLVPDGTGNVGIKTISPQHLLASYTSSPAWVLTDTDYNLNVSTAAQAEDTSAVKIYVRSGDGAVDLASVDGHTITLVGQSSPKLLIDGTIKYVFSSFYLYPWSNSISLGINSGPWKALFLDEQSSTYYAMAHNKEMWFSANGDTLYRKNSSGTIYYWTGTAK